MEVIQTEGLLKFHHNSKKKGSQQIIMLKRKFCAIISDFPGRTRSQLSTFQCSAHIFSIIKIPILYYSFSGMKSERLFVIYNNNIVYICMLFDNDLHIFFLLHELCVYCYSQEFKECWIWSLLTDAKTTSLYSRSWHYHCAEMILKYAEQKLTWRRTSSTSS